MPWRSCIRLTVSLEKRRRALGTSLLPVPRKDGKFRSVPASVCCPSTLIAAAKHDRRFICNAPMSPRNGRGAGRDDDLAVPPIKLPRGTVLRLRERAGTTVTAFGGTVWITEEGSPGDVLLTPGERFTLARPGLALVEAFRSDASISIDAARER